MLRLAGPPGVGKSTVGWGIANRLAARGERVAQVDIDQLGMCYPAPEGDADRWLLKELGLSRIAAVFAEAGVTRIVVSGVASPDEAPPEPIRDGTRSIWLDASAQTRWSRLASREWTEARVQEAVAVGSAESERLGQEWERLQTDGLTQDGAVEAILARWPVGPSGGSEPTWRPVGLSHLPVLWITGPRCVGSSSVGWAIAADEWRAGRRTGFADLAQLSFAWNIDRDCGLRNVVALQSTFAEAGAEAMIVVAPFELTPSAVRTGFNASPVSFIRLDATVQELRERTAARARGGGPRLAGDDIVGAPPSCTEAVVRAARAQRQSPMRAGEMLVDTTGTDVAGAVSRALAVVERARRSARPDP